MAVQIKTFASNGVMKQGRMDAHILGTRKWECIPKCRHLGSKPPRVSIISIHTPSSMSPVRRLPGVAVLAICMCILSYKTMSLNLLGRLFDVPNQLDTGQIVLLQGTQARDFSDAQFKYRQGRHLDFNLDFSQGQFTNRFAGDTISMYWKREHGVEGRSLKRDRATSSSMALGSQAMTCTLAGAPSITPSFLPETLLTKITDEGMIWTILDGNSKSLDSEQLDNLGPWRLAWRCWTPRYLAGT
mmetsp:Transcript_54322/g.175637  ORF Transcript_54322/g.175637 Transcript_54322/m.175637 type:complete len:243 (+) Transcript_54322:100-828(+)